MRRRFLVVVLLVAATLMARGGPALADDAILKASLNGANERPGPGDADATGSALIFIDDESDRLCVFMSWRNVDGTPSGLHIHFAPPTIPGPIVVPFATPAAGSTSTFQCVSVPNEALLDNIAANPSQYYINLHSTPSFAAGAIRGQLAKA